MRRRGPIAPLTDAKNLGNRHHVPIPTVVSSAVVNPRRLSVRQHVGLAIHASAAILLIPGFLLVAPPTRWNDPGLLVTLGVLAIIASRSEVPLPGGVTFDGAIALMLLAVALSGPLAALGVAALPVLANAVTGRRRLLREGNLSELAHSGWQAISASLVLQAAGGTDGITSPGALGWLMAAGFALYTVGWAVGPAVYGPLWLGQPFRALANALVDMLPAGTVMIVLGAVTVVLTAPLGLLALAVFALIAVLPQSFLTYAARTHPVARLDLDTAIRRYAHALAIQLKLSRAERRHLAAAEAAARRIPPTGDPLHYVGATLQDPSLANDDAQLITEWWNGRGGPIGLSADGIPMAARVLAVAQTWSSLTARGTPELGHREALMYLRSTAGTRLDPVVVQAAHAVICQERVTAAEPAPEPRLHQLRIPAPLRRALTAS